VNHEETQSVKEKKIKEKERKRNEKKKRNKDPYGRVHEIMVWGKQVPRSSSCVDSKRVFN
jgi:hypothetical protein